MFEFFANNYYASMLLVVAAMVFSIAVSGMLKSTFSKYRSVNSSRGVPANVIARQILDSYGIYNVDVMCDTASHDPMKNYYDPKNKNIVLSNEVFNSASVASIGIAAHEVGHAVQHNKNYLPMKLRSAIFPVVQIGSSSWIILFVLGIFFRIPFLVNIGIVFFALTVVFQFVTLPVEFNASRRAISSIKSQSLLEADEIGGAKKVLSAAAMTYLAGLFMSIAQLLRLIASSNRRR